MFITAGKVVAVHLPQAMTQTLTCQSVLGDRLNSRHISFRLFNYMSSEKHSRLDSEEEVLSKYSLGSGNKHVNSRTIVS